MTATVLLIMATSTFCSTSISAVLTVSLVTAGDGSAGIFYTRARIAKNMDEPSPTVTRPESI